MTQYAVQSPAHAGAVVTLAVPSGTTGDTVQPTPGGALLFVNGLTAATVTLPFATGLPKTDGQTVASRTVVVGASATALVPVPTSVYGNALQPVNYTNVTTITVAYIFIPTT